MFHPVAVELPGLGGQAPAVSMAPSPLQTTTGYVDPHLLVLATVVTFWLLYAGFVLADVLDAHV